MKIASKMLLASFFCGFLFLFPIQTAFGNECCKANERYCCDRFWAEAEYLYWQIKSTPQPVPLVATGPIVPNQTPVLGQPGTSVVLGGHDIHNKLRSGGRFTAGYWFCKDPTWGVEASYMFLAKASKTHSVSSSGQLGSQFLTLPFFDPVANRESSTRIALPGSFSGAAVLKVTNDMQGAELNGLMKWGYSCNFDWNLIAGFRYWNFDERLVFTTNSPDIVNPDVFKTEDQFHTRNNFYGGQVGLGARYTWDRFFLKAKGKIALGAMQEQVLINGNLMSTDFSATGALETFPAGYLAASTNSGKHSRTRFAFIPEAIINLGYQFTDCLSLQVGYTFLYVNNVVRAGNQIDRTINPSQVPGITLDPSTALVGTPRPMPLSKTSSLWAQGLNVGLEYSF